MQIRMSLAVNRRLQSHNRLNVEIVYRNLKKFKKGLDGSVHFGIDDSFRLRFLLHTSGMPTACEGNKIETINVLLEPLHRQRPMESFFDHFKNDINFKQATSLSELKWLADDYMKDYKRTRKQ